MAFNDPIIGCVAMLDEQLHEGHQTLIRARRSRDNWNAAAICAITSPFNQLARSDKSAVVGRQRER